MKAIGMRYVVGALLGIAWAASAVSAADPAVGLWKNQEPNRTIMIRTWEDGGKLMGKVEKVLKNGAEDTTGKCPKCEGERKDQPVVGMTIIWDMHKDGSKWTGGKILEPDTGKIYACKIEPSADGSKLNVRGSIAFLGKTQTWTRSE